VNGARHDNQQSHEILAENFERKYLPCETTRAYHVRYAYHYKCPQVFGYDGIRMLIVRLRANDREDIKRCNGDMFVIPNIAGPGGIHIRYALYRLMVDGLHRLMATTAPPVMILPYTRRFYWFSGEPYWVDGSNIKYSSVPGVVRTHMQNLTANWQLAWTNQGVFAAWCCNFF
jgi:hypothetical protein